MRFLPCLTEIRIWEASVSGSMAGETGGGGGETGRDLPLREGLIIYSISWVRPGDPIYNKMGPFTSGLFFLAIAKVV